MKNLLGRLFDAKKNNPLSGFSSDAGQHADGINGPVKC
jgi:hypothetical protein